MHLKLVSFELLAGAVDDRPVQVCHVDVGAGHQSGAAVEQWVRCCSICQRDFGRLRLHHLSRWNGLLLQLMHE